MEMTIEIVTIVFLLRLVVTLRHRPMQGGQP